MRALTARTLLALAAGAVLFAAADTYVIVLALPDMMSSVGLDVDDLQRAAPVVSGFLLGYVGILPLIGRISDLRGRVPVLVASMCIFAVGSVITAASYDFSSMVAGRLVQGVGGGGVIPPTLALVADLWPPQRRGLPLGLVGAVQELGSVLGPIYGAVVLAFGDWRDIFWLNCAIGFVLAAALLAPRSFRPPVMREARPVGRPDWPGIAMLLLAAGCAVLTMLRPRVLTEGITTGLAFLPIWSTSRWLTPLGLAAIVVFLAFIVRQATARRPLVDWREWRTIAAHTDVLGAGLLAIALAAVIVSFASAAHQDAGISAAAWWLLPIAVVCIVLFAWRQRRAPAPLIPAGTLARRPAWAALLVSFFTGAALIAALVDIPFYARLTTERHSQVCAAFVLLHFLIALPIGAVIGGWLMRWIPAPVIAGPAMLLASGAFVAMTFWRSDALTHVSSDIAMVVAGLGFGLAIAPVNAALLAHTAHAVHGVASGLLIVARMVGMLVGISVLTSISLWAFYSASERIPPISQLCYGPTMYATYQEAVTEAALSQLHAVFWGAAVCALIAAVSCAALISDRPKSECTVLE